MKRKTQLQSFNVRMCPLKFVISWIILVIMVSGCSNTKVSLTNHEWLLGSWQRINVKPGRTTTEIWKRVSPTEFYGIGISIEKGDTVFVEKLKILLKDGEAYYSAEVSHNEDPVLFKLTSSENNNLVYENPKHDFPKIITYKKTGDNTMTATISGDGKAIDFNFKKLK